MELVRSILAEGERGDWHSADWAHPEIEFNIADGPEPGIRIGVAAMAESWQGWLNAWEDFRMEAEEYRELDNERVLYSITTADAGRPAASTLARRGRRLRPCSMFATAR